MAQTMMTDFFDIAVFIGRFQPFHQGHMAACLSALERADRLLILVGSAKTGALPKNPWTFTEVSAMIRAALPQTLNKRVLIHPLLDSLYDNQAWINRVERLIAQQMPSSKHVALLGYEKDVSSKYLSWFGQWGRIHVSRFMLPSTGQQLDATMLRECIWLDKPIPKDAVAKTTFNMLENYRSSEDCHDLSAAWRWQCDHEARFATTFVLILTCRNQVALLKRQVPLGQGQWALPCFSSAGEQRNWLAQIGLNTTDGYTHQQASLVLKTVYENHCIDIESPVVNSSYCWFDVSTLTEIDIFADHRSLLYQPLSLNF